MKESVRKIITIIIFIIIVCGLFLINAAIDNFKWNEGYCEKCGGKWIFTNGSITKHNTTIYWYVCENCNNVIKTDTSME